MSEQRHVVYIAGNNLEGVYLTQAKDACILNDMGYTVLSCNIPASLTIEERLDIHKAMMRCSDFVFFEKDWHLNKSAVIDYKYCQTLRNGILMFEDLEDALSQGTNRGITV